MNEIDPQDSLTLFAMSESGRALDCKGTMPDLGPGAADSVSQDSAAGVR